jgi:hypothetical protein
VVHFAQEGHLELSVVVLHLVAALDLVAVADLEAAPLDLAMAVADLEEAVVDLVVAVDPEEVAVDLVVEASFEKWSVFPVEFLNFQWDAAFSQ